MVVADVEFFRRVGNQIRTLRSVGKCLLYPEPASLRGSGKGEAGPGYCLSKGSQCMGEKGLRCASSVKYFLQGPAGFNLSSRLWRAHEGWLREPSWRFQLPQPAPYSANGFTLVGVELVRSDFELDLYYHQ